MHFSQLPHGWNDSATMPIRRQKPIVDQIDDLLRERIYHEVYAPGSRLPSENELLREFGVSRATVRAALGRLATEGLIIRRQGEGTYVNEHLRDVNAHSGELWAYEQLIRRNGYTPSAQVLGVEQRAASEAEVAALALAAQQPVLSWTQLYLADNHPVILATSVIPCTPAAAQTVQVAVDGALAELVQRCGQERIAYTICDLRAVVADAAVGHRLGLQAGDPLLQMVRTFYDGGNRPVALTTAYFETSWMKLRLIRAW